MVMEIRKKLLVIGNGMAGVATVEEILASDPDAFDITIFGEEPHANYNRILLSSVLAGEADCEDVTLNPRQWYEDNDVTLLGGVAVNEINPGRETVTAAGHGEVSYDKLLIATGSKAFVPPIQGVDQPGVFTFRSLDDTLSLIAWAETAQRAVVIGGGLLGLEAARGLATRGLRVTVAHLMDRLMEQQLDYPAAGILKQELEEMGIEVLLEHSVGEICGSGSVEEVHFSNGLVTAADLVIIATGVRPETGLARGAGLLVNRGIVVGDHMETSHPDIHAVGDCVEHRGRVYGLVEPLREQAKAAAAAMLGDNTVCYAGSMVSTRLKVAGIPLAVVGDLDVNDSSCEELVYSDAAESVYRKLIIRGGRVTGAILMGDLEGEQRFKELVRSREDVTGQRKLLLAGAAESAPPVAHMPDTAVICGCMGISKGDIVRAIRDHGLTSREGVSEKTRACTSCKGCSPLIDQILKLELGGEYVEAGSGGFACGCVPLSWEDARAEVKSRGLKSVGGVLQALGNGAGCSSCRPALSYMLAELWIDDYKEEEDSLYENDRLHANVQKGGTFSVIPRMYGGVTTPAELRRLADAAEKYGASMIKVTGGQRLALMGVSGSDLQSVWADLDMPSGHAYTKAVRTCKTCVGDVHCSFGLKDSLALGIEMERRYQGIPCPGKVKMAVSGCPRNCSETSVKDIGVVGVQDGWEIYVGGAAGSRLRAAGLLAAVAEDKQVIRLVDAFLQYYRENARHGERTGHFVERVGIDRLRKIVAGDERGIVDRLAARMEEVVAACSDPWAGSKVCQGDFEDMLVWPEEEVKDSAPVRPFVREPSWR